MSQDEQLEQKVSQYATLAKENKNIDVASLMMSALGQKDNTVSSRAKRWAYLISISLPPFGLLFALKYYVFSGEDDAKTVATSCVILTVLSVGLFWIIGKTMLSSSGTSLEQIQQITPQEIKSTLGP
ncbi:MAG: hypothetical protein KGJ93_02260 [Patescibacteria group bacterium]|nr:hypothetical protein [Patescibacteria group bacterium]